MDALYKRLKTLRAEKDIAWETIELDYTLSFVLEAIAQHEILSKNLVFKGGTALKKCWFGNYRYSQDLDFTEIEKSSNEEILNCMQQVFNKASEILEPYGEFRFEVEEYKLKSPHPFDQAAFNILATLPWQRKPLTKIKVEITREEVLALKPISKPLLHEYGEKLEGELLCYQLEEIVAEKFRGILQNQEKYRRKGWTRPRVRDYYDLWRIFSEYKENLKIDNIRSIFPDKCKAKDIEFRAPGQFFEADFMAYVKKDWSKFLQGLTKELPEFDTVIVMLQRSANEIF